MHSILYSALILYFKFSFSFSTNNRYQNFGMMAICSNRFRGVDFIAHSIVFLDISLLLLFLRSCYFCHLATSSCDDFVVLTRFSEDQGVAEPAGAERRSHFSELTPSPSKQQLSSFQKRKQNVQTNIIAF